MNIILIANCHVQPLTYLIEMSSGINSVVSIPVHLKGTTHYDNPIRKIEESSLEYIVLQFPGLVESIDFTESTRAKFIKVLTFTNIYFTGFHPDCCYVGGMGMRVTTPLGDYHSKICYLSFSKGYTVDQCYKLFTGDVFESLGYNAEWENSTNELLRRDEIIDIKFAQDFLNLSEVFLTLLTFNHPTALVFYKLAQKILCFLGLAKLGIPCEATPNFLYNNAVWPVYPSLKHLRGLGGAHSCEYHFKSPDALGKRVLSLREFVEESYSVYSLVQVQNIKKTYFHDNLIGRI